MTRGTEREGKLKWGTLKGVGELNVNVVILLFPKQCFHDSVVDDKHPPPSIHYTGHAMSSLTILAHIQFNKPSEVSYPRRYAVEVIFTHCKSTKRRQSKEFLQ